MQRHLPPSSHTIAIFLFSFFFPPRRDASCPIFFLYTLVCRHRSFRRIATRFSPPLPHSSYTDFLSLSPSKRFFYRRVVMMQHFRGGALLPSLLSPPLPQLSSFTGKLPFGNNHFSPCSEFFPFLTLLDVARLLLLLVRKPSLIGQSPQLVWKPMKKQEVHWPSTARGSHFPFLSQFVIPPPSSPKHSTYGKRGLFFPEGQCSLILSFGYDGT